MEFQITGIVLLLVFYGGYFIKMASQRRKGIKTDQIGVGKDGAVKYIEITMKIVACLVLAAEVVSIFSGTTLFAAPVRLAGVFIGGAGVLIFLVSVVTMQDSWRAGVAKSDQTELVTGGIYQISRNPAFLGFDLVHAGIAMMFFNWALFVASCLAVMMFHLQIVKVEEKFLAQTFGDEYVRYKKKVCRYLGRKR